MNANEWLLPPTTAQRLPVRMDRLQASTLLEKEIISWDREAEAHDRDNKEILAPVTVIKGEAGLGKTVKVLNHIRHRLQKKPKDIHAYYVPTIELAVELQKKARLAGIDNVIVNRGRSQPQPGQMKGEGAKLMCGYASEAEQLSRLGVSIKETLCRSKGPDGEVRECPLAATCLYLRQTEAIKKGGLIICAHQYLTLPIDGLDRIDYRYIDESFWQTMISQRAIDLNRFMSIRGVGQGFKRRKAELVTKFEDRRREQDWELEDAIIQFRTIIQQCQAERRDPTLADFRADTATGRTGFTPAFCEHLATLEYSRYTIPDIYPGMPIELVRSKLDTAQISEAVGFARVWTILGIELATGRTGEPHGLVIKRAVEGDKLHLYWHRKPRQLSVPTLILDADADQIINSVFFENAKFVEIAAQWQNVKVIQAFDRVGTTKTMSRESNRDEAYNLAAYLALLTRDQVAGIDKRRPLFIAQKSVIADLGKDGGLEGVAFQPEHLGNLRGKDEFNEVSGLVMAGRREPTVDQAQQISRCLHIGSTEQLLFLWMTTLRNGTEALVFLKRKILVTPKIGQAREVEVSYHPDPRIEVIRYQVCNAEAMQALARPRPVHRSREFPCIIIALTSIELSVQPDELWEWNQIVPDSFTKVRTYGVQFENAADLADAYPTVFPSHDAARKALSRRGERALQKCDKGDIYTSISGLSQLEESQRLLVYRRAEGIRRRKVVVDLQRGETFADACARVLALLPDAHSFQDITPRLEMPENASTASEIDLRGIGQKRKMSEFAILLAELSADEQSIFFNIGDRQKYFEGRKCENLEIPATINSIFELLG